MKAVAILTAAFAAGVSALQITAPGINDSWDLSKTNTIKWTFVDTDPTEFQIQLVNKDVFPVTTYNVTGKATTKDGKFDLTNFVAPPSSKYTVKFISLSATNSGQLSESQTFNVTKSGTSSTSTTAGTPSSTGGSGTTASQSTTPSSAAVALGKTFGVAGPIAAALAMLL
ncbi:hypothetical protein B0H67DRAFT_236500 [Lasiosphaeris hirsuta]|uniref:Yeast cell wall synthesis Kre9/Knh1-like N-terminal domain-containing protein n=1 Tax=Lasiosphaeris hirsuta TaxID=260670 RepID=A0AA40AG35_9PEZI|nr:hypothetical protein B0H67DRAFT_236500 [Lasiosphaeris hirsuta]